MVHPQQVTGREIHKSYSQKRVTEGYHDPEYCAYQRSRLASWGRDHILPQNDQAAIQVILGLQKTQAFAQGVIEILVLGSPGGSDCSVPYPIPRLSQISSTRRLTASDI